MKNTVRIHRIQNDKGQGYFINPRLNYKKDPKLTELVNKISSDILVPKHIKGTSYGYTETFVKSHKQDIDNFINHANTYHAAGMKLVQMDIPKNRITFGDKDQIQFRSK